MCAECDNLKDSDYDSPELIEGRFYCERCAEEKEMEPIKRYKVVITEITEKEIVEQGDWCIVEKRPYTDDELNGIGDPTYYSQHRKEIRGYAPDVTTIKEFSREVYTQNVDDLLLENVIKAVNGI